MYDNSLKNQARNLYVFRAMNLMSISHRLKLTRQTLSRWKAKAKNNGDCWILARNNALLASNSSGNIDFLLNEFITFFNSTMLDVKNSPNISSIEKVQLISTLGDAYSKVIKSASKTDPKKTSLAIALDVIKKLVIFIETGKNPRDIEVLLPILDAFGNYYKQTVKSK